ncbi:unnamed protein product [Amaranthus hypochondriacus]
MGKYDFVEELSGSDNDDLLQEEIQTLSRECFPSNNSDGASIPATACSVTGGRYLSEDEDDDDDDDDDMELVRSIKEQYGIEVDISKPLSLKPLISLPPASSDDDDDDFETLRAIQKRFSQYGDDKSTDALECKNDNCVDKTLHEDVIATSLGSEFVYVHGDDLGENTCDVPQNVETSSCTSNFPKSAQTFVEAIKKNRSCQKFIRNKMLHIEAKMEANRALQKRLKTLRDFQVQCKKTIGRALSQKQDSRVQLISVPKQKPNIKGSEKNVSAIYYGPLENSHVALYKTTMKNYPLLFQREKWSKNEIRALEKEIIKQFQERLFQTSADLLSNFDDHGLANGVDDMISSITNLDITPEIIQEFSRKVDWNKLASRLPRRSGVECEARWLNYENCLINRDNWTSDEDKHLLLLLQKNGIHNWSYIAEKLGTNRTPFQCLVRYQRSLNASIMKRVWTEDEDAQLCSAVEAFGESNWQAVASVFEGRTGTQCSNRWRKTLLPARQRVGRWSTDEDKRLRVAVTLFGYKSWHRIAQFVPGRTQVQCRERWVNVLDPSLKHGEWTKEEDMKLKEAISEYGYCWSKIAGCVPLRTDNQCRRRWKKLFPNEVPLLKAAKHIKEVALISNFVDRESERPALGMNDFVPLPITNSANETEKEKISRTRKRKGIAPNTQSISHLKGVASRKRKRNDKSSGDANNCNDACSTDGYGIQENKKFSAIRSDSKKKKHCGNLNTTRKPLKSGKSTHSHEGNAEETNCRNMPIKTRSRRPQGNSKKQIGDGIQADLSNMVTVARNKRSSQLQLRSSFAETSFGDDCEQTELRDGNETHSMDTAGSSKEKTVKKKKKRELHADQSLEWEDLPLSILLKKDIAHKERSISNLTSKPPVKPPIYLTYARRNRNSNLENST